MDRGQGRNWYFLSPRERKYKNGDRPRRDTKDLLGRWKASTGKTDRGRYKGVKVKVAGDGTTKYWRSGLAYFHFQGREEKEKKSGWLMQEFTIPEYQIMLPKDGGPGGPTLDRYVMCRIYPAPKNKGNDDDDEAGPSNAEQVESDDEEETAELPPILSEKMAGKRPVSEARHLCSPAAAKKKRARYPNRLQIEPPAPPPPPPQDHGMQAPFRMPGYYDGSGQPMGYQAGAPMPLPLVPYNNAQVRVPRQQAAYNGQVSMMTPQPAAYNGQMPGTQQQGPYNGQMPMMTRQPAAYNGQMPLTQQYRPVGAPNNDGQVSMMTPQPAAYNGQMPGTQQPATYNGQMPMMTRQPAAYNGQTPVTQRQVAFNSQVRPPPYRPVGAPNNHGQNLTMMTRPSCPAGQAVNPPPVAPQVHRQPETGEMLEKRVVQQNLEEYLWMQQQELEMAVMMREQQDWTMALMMQQQLDQNQPYPEANADCHHHAEGNDLYASVAAEAEHYGRSRAVPPATSGSPGEAAPVRAECAPVSTVVSAARSRDSNGGNHDRAEAAAVKASPGGSGGVSAEGGMADGPQPQHGSAQ
ncbi:hypothetical protein ZWY2020_022331 [Hordeum vulgare]|nr:hypothetical protein ZWY2020_022331 [Hordeum vulgare]